MKLIFNIFTILILFFSPLLQANEWKMEYLKEMNDGCLKTAVDNVSIGQAFEYCGCSTHGIYEEFEIDEILDIFSSGGLLENRKYIRIISDCNKKIGF